MNSKFFKRQIFRNPVKALKWILIICVVFLSIGVLAVSIFLPFYDYNRLKPQISRIIFEATGRQLVIDGPLEFKIGLEPTLVVADIRFQNADWGTRPELAGAKRLELQMALLPLLKGEIEIRRCLLVDPDILIETNPAGAINLALDWAKAKKSPLGLKEPADPWKFSLTQFQIKGGRLVFKDGLSGRSYPFSVEQFQLSSFAAGQPARFQFKGAYGKINFEMTGTVEPPPDLNWEAGPWKWQAVLKNNTGVLTLDGSLQSRPYYRPKLDLCFELKAPELARLGPVIGKKLPVIGPIEIQGCFRNRAAITALPALPETWSLDLNFKALETLGALNGTFQGQGEKLTFDFDFAVEGEHLARTLRIKNQQPFDEPFKISGHVRNRGSALLIFSKVSARLAQSDLGGVVKIDYSHKPLQIRAALQARRLDLRRYLKEAFNYKKEECPANSAQPCKVFSPALFRLTLPRHIETTCALKIDQLILPQLSVAHIKAGVRQTKTDLFIQLTGSAVSGGSLNGFLSMKPDSLQTALDLQIKGRDLELGQMPQDLHLQNTIQGRMDLDIRLRSRGQSVAALMAGLDGYTILAMKAGQINNKFIGRMRMDLATGLFSLFNQPQEDDFVQIHCFVSRFDIEKGFVKTTVLLLDTPASRIVGQGTIDLGTEELNLKLRPLPKKGLGVKGVGRIRLSLGSLAKPFKLSGTLAKPTLGLDPAQAFITVGKFVAGAAAFGFAGLAVALFSTNADDANACEKAVRLARQGPKKTIPSESLKENDK
ncbi:MAG: AsmA family protein [Desulfobacteraceae bacterium]|nr:MAG: AsmA family protein [Desulfobacteraceae bacterium]